MKTSVTELGEVAAKAALAAGKVNPEIVDHTIFGHVLAVSMTRPHSSLKLKLYHCPLYLLFLMIVVFRRPPRMVPF